MLNGAFGQNKNHSLMSEYSSLLGDAVLRQRARTAEQSARIEAELASRVKSEFIANMSHELRTPLNTVIGFSKILAELDPNKELKQEDVVEYAGLIRDAAGHLLSVINDILDISKIQSGRYTLDAREIQLDSILVDCIENLSEDCHEAGIEMIRRLPIDLPSVRGDDRKLKQVFSNIISNAIKFTHQGGKIYVEAFRLPDDGAAVRVRDTGVGMTKEEIEIALTPFGQVDGTRARWREGTGLGLPISKSLIELHGGQLEILSEKNAGTAVVIHFPSRHQVSVTQGQDAL